MSEKKHSNAERQKEEAMNDTPLAPRRLGQSSGCQDCHALCDRRV